jgi:hypothetical protein
MTDTPMTDTGPSLGPWLNRVAAPPCSTCSSRSRRPRTGSANGSSMATGAGRWLQDAVVAAVARLTAG